MAPEHLPSDAPVLQRVNSASAGPEVSTPAPAPGFRDIAEARRELAFARAPIALAITELETGLFIDVNEAYCRMAEYTRDQMVGRTSIELGWARPDNRASMVEHVRVHGHVRNREVVGTTRSGRRIDALLDAELVDVGGRQCLLTSLRDVSEQRRTQQALRASEEKFAKAFMASPDAVTLTRMADAQLIDVNEGFERMTGYSRAEAIGRTSVDLQLWRDLETRDRVMNELRAYGRIRDLVCPFRHRGGDLVECSFSAEVAEINGERCVISVTRDLSERRRAEDALRASEERYRLVTERIGQLIYDFDFASDTATWTGAVERVTGYTLAEFAGVDSATWRGMIHPEDLAQALSVFRHASEHRETYRARYRLRRKDGSYATVDESGFFLTNPAGGVSRMLGIIDDVTERERLAGELMQVQKMETVGRLAGGVAHDFNNLLTVILGHLAVLRREAVVSHEAQEAVDEAARAADMAADLTRQLLTASRQQPIERAPLDLGSVVEGMATLLGRTLGEDVRFTVRADRGLPAILADRGSIEQVLLNLCVNARDAMPHGGLLEIVTGGVEIAATEALRHPEALPGRFVRLSVSDSGCGIASELIPRIFEPFFTTKPVGSGTGLGLATVYAIVKQHEGWIEVESTPGRGSTFGVYLPTTVEAPAPASRDRPVVGSIPGAGETVLLVEDETAVRRMVEGLLTRNGFRVIAASSGRDALETWEDEPVPFDVLVTDVVMPERVSGPQLVERFRSMGVCVPVIYMSGYRAGALGEVSAERGEFFIAKPFRVEEFLDTLARALGVRGRHA